MKSICIVMNRLLQPVIKEEEDARLKKDLGLLILPRDIVGKRLISSRDVSISRIHPFNYCASQQY